jgi:hypothetical protein
LKGLSFGVGDMFGHCYYLAPNRFHPSGNKEAFKPLRP